MTTPAAPWTNVVIRASAGTGKTYQLSNRYLKLAAENQPPEQILAATFARKAAGEILGRVLVRLANAAIAEPGRRELTAAVGRELTAADCLALLEQLVGALHRLRIGTLDSFFVQLAGGLTLELGLPTGWQIVDVLDDRELRLEAIRRVLAGGSTRELSTLLHLVFKGEASRSITEQIVQLVDELYGVYLETERAAWHGLPRRPQLNAAELALATEALAGARPPQDRRAAGAWQQDIGRIHQQCWEDFLKKGLSAAVFKGDCTYYKKPIDGPLVEQYRPLVDHARGVLVNRVIDQTEATYRLLAAFDEHYQQLKASERGLRFEDLPRLLSAGLTDGLMDHAAWRLDTSIDHLLLDEFQDTSLGQWSALRPFAAACCESDRGRSFFCVGDVKQAIYRWRGGVSQIFDAVRSELPGIEEQSLELSYRSSQTVIDTVNQVFGELAGNLALAEFPAVAEAWRTGFRRHATTRLELAGYSTLWVAPRAADGEKQPVVTQRYAAERIARLVEQCPGRSIGVLVRKNETVGRLIYFLRSVHKVPASEEGGNPLNDSPAVQLVLSLFQLADHPGDRVARFHVASSPLAARFDFHDHDDSRAAVRLAAALRRRLLDDGYGTLIRQCAADLAAYCEPRDLRRLTQLVELGYAFDQRITVRPGQFVEFVAATKVDDPTAAQVRVMTVHQAKGLQFDVVVLPELDVSLKSRPPKLAVGRPSPLEGIDRVCRYVSQDLHNLFPEEYQSLLNIWPPETVNESLCLLYVALTRAVHALYMIVAPGRSGADGAAAEKTFPKTFSGVLRSALVGAAPLEPETAPYVHGLPTWPTAGVSREADGAGGARAQQLEPHEIDLRLPTANAAPRELERRSPSSLEGAGRVWLGQRLDPSAGTATARGTLWHAWFEQIEWLADAGPAGEPSNEQLTSIALAVEHALDLEAQIAQFRRVLAQADVRRVLCRAAYDDPAQLGFSGGVLADLARGGCNLRLHRERRFAVREAAGLMSGTIDRLVLLTRGEEVLAADIIDFKTDRVTAAGELERRVDFYRPQLAAYRRAVAQLYGLGPERVVSRLVFLESGVVRPVR